MGKVFISYSHNSPEHSERVLALSNRLLALGVDAELDRYHVRPPQGWPHWCEEQLRPETSSFVLVVCTPTYRARVENASARMKGAASTGKARSFTLPLQRQAQFTVHPSLAGRGTGNG